MKRSLPKGVSDRMRMRTGAIIFIVLSLLLWCPYSPRAAVSESGALLQFERDVLPIIKDHCHRCHGDRTQKAELDLRSLEGVRAGSESGSVVVPGDPDTSKLLQVLLKREMPPPEEEDTVTDEEIDLIRRWIQHSGDFEVKGRSEPTLSQHDVLPILMLRCATCHGRQVQEGGLDIRRLEFMLKGGESGPAIVPGKPDESLMVKRVEAEEMPPRDKLASHSVKPMEAGELAVLKQWIAVGTPTVTEVLDVATTEPDPLVGPGDRDHWAFQTVGRSSPPIETLKAGGPGANHSIDAFVAAKLGEKGLGFSPEADKYSLLRRLYLNLIGLLPEPEAIAEFVSDPDPSAYSKVVDRLLASTAYGERWGQFWLDLAGYADSEGVQHADPMRPHAYRYRDYVIRAFNADKPYDRFLLEQIAGDELADYENAPEITPEIYDNLVATGFLRMISDGTFAGITGFVPSRLDVIDDQIRVLSSSVMGLSIRCARCHSHKFDPIPQRDYYRMVAVFKGAMDEHDWLRPIEASVGSSRYLPYVPAEERLGWEAKDRALTASIDAVKARLEFLKQQEENEARDEQIKVLEKEIQQIEAKRTSEPMIRALWDRGEPSPTYLLTRGDYRQPSRLVGPGVPSVLTDGKTPFEVTPPWPGSKKTGSRLAMARWLVHADHPLTARVMVNRIWKHHFGRGLVETLDDFGVAGARPSHPDLLDWLASEFVRGGWSVKRMHRLMVNSRTYRQTSVAGTDSLRLDPENRWWSRMPMKRMDAEVIRDTLLQASGRLRRVAFGPPDGVSVRKDGLVTSTETDGSRRRSIYVVKRRTERLTILDNFDRPRMSPNCIERPVSNVAPQALHMMNNQMVHDLSSALADRVMAEAGESKAQQVKRLYLLTLSREPSKLEKSTTLEALDELERRWAKEGDGLVSPEIGALRNVCHALINSAGFLYID